MSKILYKDIDFQSKDEIRRYIASIKPRDEEAERLVQLIPRIGTFDVSKISVREYDLDIPVSRFINAVSSAYYQGRVGRCIHFLVYHDTIPVGVITLSSPVINSPLWSYLKSKGIAHFKQLNDKVVELATCVALENIRQILGAKLCAYISISHELIGIYNEKYKTDIEYLFTTSLYGKSSVYNRIKDLKFIGYSEGYHSCISREVREKIIKEYKREFPHRKITKSALANHIIRLYLHLREVGKLQDVVLPKLKRGVYICERFDSLQNRINEWYQRWYLPRFGKNE